MPLKRVFDPVEHQNAENTLINTSTASTTLYYNTLAIGATLVSQSITITKRCCIVVVTICAHGANTAKTQIQRGGVNKTTETTISPVNWGFVGGYGHLQYASEVLDAGTYTYALVNSSGATLSIAVVAMKAVAVTAS